MYYGCWTWYLNHELPQYEVFYKTDLRSDPNSQNSKIKKINLPLKYLSHKSPIEYFIHKIIKILPLFIVNFLRRKFILKMNQNNYQVKAIKDKEELLKVVLLLKSAFKWSTKSS